MPMKHRSSFAEAIHGTVSGLHKAGLIDTKTLRDFDRRCLTEVLQLSAAQIASLRKREGVSQGVFAQHLNVNPSSSANGSAARRSQAARPCNCSHW